MQQFEVIGNNQIEINYDGVTVSLLIDKNVHTILVNGPYQCSENFFFINYKSNKFFLKDLENIKIELDPPSLSKIKSFLENFETGNYCVFQLVGNTSFIEHKENNLSRLYFSNKSNRIVVYTKSSSDLNKKTINNYKEKIINGESPIIFLYSKTYYGAELENIFFVIQRNEILKAYQDLNLEPKLIAMVNYNEIEYENSNQAILKIISSHKEIKETSYKYFY